MINDHFKINHYTCLKKESFKVFSTIQMLLSFSFSMLLRWFREISEASAAACNCSRVYFLGTDQNFLDRKKNIISFPKEIEFSPST